MVIFLYGLDDYRRGQRKKYWITEFEKKYSGLSVGSFDLVEPFALENLKNFTRGQSIFEDKKLAIVDNLYEAEEKIAAKVLQLLVVKKATDTNTTTFLFSEKKSPNKALRFLLEAPVRPGSSQAAKVEEFENLAGSEWEKFIRAEALRLGAALADDAVRFLAEMYAGNGWALVTELEKLSSIGKAVSRKELEFAGLEIAPNYWAMVNSLKSYDIKNRLSALETLFASGDPPPKIFNILSSMWREKLPQMAEYDLKIKSGKLEYEEALVDLVL